MELIPILSTIILVARICSFILAIGAYILYKVRERKGTQSVPAAPQTVQGELVAPVETRLRRAYTVERPVEVRQPSVQSGIDWRGSQPKTTPQPRQFTGNQKSFKEPGSFHKQTQGKPYTESKFLKYTSEGYVPPEEEKDKGELRWR